MEHDRVTAILYPFSGLNKVPPAILDAAKERGTKVHEVYEAILEDMGYHIDEQYSGYVKSLEAWCEGKIFLDRPSRWFCDDLMLTGECDGLYLDDGKVVLVDIKTPLRESKTWQLQGSAYAYLARKNGQQVDRVEFVQVKKDGSAATVHVYKEDFATYRKCLDLYRIFFKDAVDYDGEI
jgi:ATP-dependent exoDNAse (exonuclease V) beta subunit